MFATKYKQQMEGALSRRHIPKEMVCKSLGPSIFLGKGLVPNATCLKEAAQRTGKIHCLKKTSLNSPRSWEHKCRCHKKFMTTRRDDPVGGAKRKSEPAGEEKKERQEDRGIHPAAARCWVIEEAGKDRKP